ncbi:MAG TPA: protein kinase [Holophagaceae bacterium]|nr:protein kinase [Holophagaceae bacterium]
MPQSTPSLQRLRFLRAAMDRGLLTFEAIFGPRPQDSPTLSESDWLMRFEVLRAQGLFGEGPLGELLKEHHLEAARPSAPDDLSTFPERLKDRFEPLSKLGEGGMGIVYKAYDRRLERTVALKFLKHLEAETWNRFLREARSQAQLDHPHVGRVFEVVQDEERPHLVLQYIDGPTLAEARDRLGLREIVLLAAQVAEALDACHRSGILHRDLKPGNVMLERKADGTWHPYLVDFGLARNMESTEATLPGILIGTPAYSAPEVLRGEEADPRSDVYGLGATLYSALTGQMPFEAATTWELLRRVQDEDPPPPRALRSDIPADLEVVILKSMEKDPGRRYATALALGADLRRFLEGDAIQAHPASWGYRLGKRVRKQGPRVLLLAGTALAFLLLAAALWNWRQARIQAGLAQSTTKAVDQLELEVNRELALPLHDVRPALDRVRGDLDRLRGGLEGRSAWVQGPARVALGRGYAALGLWEEARAQLTKAWKEGRQRDPETASLLGTTLAHLHQQSLEGLRAKAREDRRKELEPELRRPALDFLKQAADPGNPQIQALVASLEDRPEEARPFLSRLQSQQSWNPEGWLLQAELDRIEAGAAMAHGRYPEAEASVARALEALGRAGNLQRSNPRVALAQAQSYQLQLAIAMDLAQEARPAFDRALEASNRSIAVDSGNPKAWSARSALFRLWAMHLLRQGADPSEPLQSAAEAAEAGLKLQPEDNELWNNLGTLLRTRAGWEAERGLDPSPTLAHAVACLRGALARPQIKDFLLNNLGNCLSAQAEWALNHGGDPRPLVEEASRCFQEAMTLRPWVGHPASEGGALKLAAQYEHWVRGNPGPYLDRAIAAYQEALTLNPNSFLTHQWLAEAFLHRAEWMPGGRARDLDAAGRHVQKALALNPRSREALAHQALHAILTDRWIEAERALRAIPDPGEAIMLRVRLALQRRQGLAALEPPMRRARKATPWDGQLALWHGRLLEGLGRNREAEGALVEARTLNPNLDRPSRAPFP